jgi:plastocyanin
VTARTKLAAGLAFGIAAGAACAPASNTPNIPIRQVAGSAVISVVDSLYDAGRGASAAVDADGNAVVTYLLYQPVLKAGDIPPGVKVGELQPPAVVLATQSNGIWTRVSVTAQTTSPAQGDAPELANDQGQAVPDVNTALAVDAQGHHHVVWATPKGVYYATDAGGAFGASEQVTGSAAVGGSVAVASDGTVWVSYYDRGSVVAAHRDASGWTRETVDADSGQSGDPATVTAIRVGSSGRPVVAYGADAQTAVAARSDAGSWSAQQVSGDGGYGVSLVLDPDDNGHVAYYDAQGTVHEADQSGGTWAVNQVATTAPGPGESTNPRWSTGIGVDDQRTVSVAYLDGAADVVKLATGKGSSFTTDRIEGSEHGGNPAAAVSADGTHRIVAWFDTENANLVVAQTGIEGLAIAHPTSPATLPSVGPTKPTEAPCQPSGTDLKITAANIAFDVDCLAAPADQAFTIDFTNNDSGTPHNVDILDQAGGTHLGGATGPTDTVTGPASVTYNVDPLKSGIYYFQCDIHPNMSGTFVVGTGG